MRSPAEHALLAAAVESAELGAEIAARHADLDAGLVPVGVTRALFAHELTARTNFAGIEDDVADLTEAIRRAIAADRDAMLTLVTDDLRRVALQPAPGSRIGAIAGRLLDIDGPDGIGVVDGGRRLLEGAERRVRGLLERAVARGADRAFLEAVAQGLLVPDGIGPKITDVQGEQLGLIARQAAQAHHVDLIRALRAKAIELEKDLVHPEDFVEQLAEHARGLSTSPLEDLARASATQANSIGRVAAANALPPPKAIYASELLDRNTCGPCSLVDGKEYLDLAAARLDYPHGTYVRCDGGIRCRGTLVFVWPTEEDPTLDEPGDTGRPAPPAAPVSPAPVAPPGGPAGAAPLARRHVDPADRIDLPAASGLRRDLAAVRSIAVEVLDVIGDIHGLPAAAGTIPLRVDPNLRLSQGAEGATRFRGGRAVDIAIDANVRHPELTIAHEFGHYVDAEAIGALGSDASVVDPLLDAWRTAVEGSDGWKALRDLADSLPAGDRTRLALEGYLLQPYELWARSYSQWVATRSGNEAMLDQVAQRAARTIPDQWTDEDFEPIAEAIDELMANVGLAR